MDKLLSFRARQIATATGIGLYTLIVFSSALLAPVVEAQSQPVSLLLLLATSTPGPGQTTYVVKQGDTIYSIARAFGVKPVDIQTLNNLPDPSAIKTGQVLLIPAATTVPTSQVTASPTPQLQPTAAPIPLLSTTPAPSAAMTPQASQPRDARYFEETGFRVANEQFWNYFNRRGGIRTFGYPISKEFVLLGFRVQLFQRAILQLNPDGSVATMNLLDDGLMPYTRINTSTFPALDQGLVQAAPAVGSEGYFENVLQFIKEKCPDQWQGLPVSFYRAFNETVRYEEAFPQKDQDPGMLQGINLEIWGVPTSAPIYDPNNKNFVYLRFQRGIMHYDKTSGATQGLLLGQYLKSIITGINLPADLEQQAKGSRLYRQYNPLAPNGLSRPAELPGTDLKGAFSLDGLVVLDPGHGGSEIGTGRVLLDGTVLSEKQLNLKVAQKTAELLRQAGQPVLLTRTTDAQVNNPPRDLTGDGEATMDDDIQARIDIANNSRASLLLSIHFNGSVQPELRGVEVYYNSSRPFAGKSKQFAQLVLDNYLAAVKSAGYQVTSRGIKEDERAAGKGDDFYLLGPLEEGRPRASQMVGVLVEGGFVTNDADAALIRQEKFLDAVARGYAQAILQWFQASR
jgi:N-acetylmuramoyl-L-alanine amidase